ncbi:hypothetical protein BaRGS_00028446, partial [Batillaria attramentaria]
DNNYTSSGYGPVVEGGEEDPEGGAGMTDVSVAGVCPRPQDPPGPCVQQCRHHSDCRANHACCHNGCGHTCTFLRPDTVVKPGSCPRGDFRQRTSFQCDDSCQADGDCPGNQKCCRSACGMTCRVPCFYWLASNSRVRPPWRLSQRCSRSFFLL